MKRSGSKTQIPEFVIVYGKEIPVILKDHVYDENGEELDGDTDGHTISISKGAKKSEHLSILLHEIWHCIIRRSGVYYRSDHDTQLEEQMAEYFQTVIQENFILRSRH
jgi:hypothetical protein